MPPEFTAVILAGDGQGLDPITSTAVPKALLPIALQPLISRVVHALDQVGITRIIIVTHPSLVSRLNDHVALSDELDIEVVGIDVGANLDVLRRLRDKSDVIFMSCDMVIDGSLEPVLDMYRVERASLTFLLSEQPKYDTLGSQREQDVRLLLGMDAGNKNVVHYASLTAVSSDVNISMTTLQKAPTVNLYTCFKDVHFYILKRWVLDFIARYKDIECIREDLLPILTKSYSSPSVALKYRLGKSQPDAIGTPNSSPPSLSDPDFPSPKLCAYFVPSSVACFRVRSIGAFHHVNRLFAAKQVVTTPTSDSLVGQDTKVGERCSFKKSVIGSHCTIGRNVKLVGCIVMDYVTLEDNVRLEGCVISHHATVKEKASLKDCEVGPHHTVAAETNKKSECMVREDDDAY